MPNTIYDHFYENIKAKHSKGPISPGKSINVEHLIFHWCVIFLLLFYIFKISQGNSKRQREMICQRFLRRNGLSGFQITKVKLLRVLLSWSEEGTWVSFTGLWTAGVNLIIPLGDRHPGGCWCMEPSILGQELGTGDSLHSQNTADCSPPAAQSSHYPSSPTELQPRGISRKKTRGPESMPCSLHLFLQLLQDRSNSLVNLLIHSDIRKEISYYSKVGRKKRKALTNIHWAYTITMFIMMVLTIPRYFTWCFVLN